MAQQFEQSYQQQYGITLPDKALVVATITAEAIGKTTPNAFSPANLVGTEEISPERTVFLFCEDRWVEAPDLSADQLAIGQQDDRACFDKRQEPT